MLKPGNFYRSSYVLILLTVLSVSLSAQEQKPVTERMILDTLKASRTGAETTNKILAKQIGDRGVAFEITTDIERRLLENGASDDLINAIRFRLCDDYVEKAKKCPEEDTDCRLTNYGKAISFHPGDSAVLIERGTLFDDLDRFGEAVADYTKAIEADPKAHEAYNNRGNSLASLNRIEEAIHDYSKAIELEPNKPDYYFNRGATYYNSQRYELSLKDYNKYVAMKPDDAAAYDRRGDANFELQRFTDAIKDYSSGY
jgi:tetratricopeptide (TPR) repeat protein